MTRSNYHHIVSLILIFLIQSTFAANIIVNTTIDNENAGDGKCTLREAVNNANINSDNTERDCKKGKGADTITSTEEIGYISLGSSLKITDKIRFKNLSIEGAAFVINSYFNDFIIVAEFEDVSLSRSGIQNRESSLTIKNSHFISSPITNENGFLTIKNSTFEFGSGIRTDFNEIDWSLLPWGGVSIGKSTFRENSSITHMIFPLSIVDSTFSNNSRGRGGALYLEGAETVSIVNSTFSGNSATGKGGAIFNQGEFHWRSETPIDSRLSITNSTFFNNSAPRGGGIFNNRLYFIADSSGRIEEGDGCFICERDYENNQGFCDDKCWFIQGYVIETIEGRLSLRNTIIANNEGGEDCYNDGPYFSAKNNFIGDASCNSEYSGDPHLGPLRDNEGPTMTHALLEGSPAIDAGDDASCSSRDQRGMPRTKISAGKHCDIGAFEFQFPDLVELLGFTVTPHEKGILFKWETAVERDSSEFYLWQADPSQGGCQQYTNETRLTDRAFSSQGNETQGASYEYVYEGSMVPNSCYGLEERETSGKINFYIIDPGIEKWKTFSITPQR